MPPSDVVEEVVDPGEPLPLPLASASAAAAAASVCCCCLSFQILSYNAD